MEANYRQLTVDEMGLLEKLLSRDFPGRDALKLQLSSVSGRRIDTNGTLELRSGKNNLADVEMSCPTEGTCPDIDGGTISVLLHVKRGELHLLEILKYGGAEEILRPPKAEALTVY